MNRYTITEAISDVVEALRLGSDHSATTIRCTLNDCLDAASKDGKRVRFDYNQELAVRRHAKSDLHESNQLFAASYRVPMRSASGSDRDSGAACLIPL